jgi:replicative DNA helicase
VFDEIRTEHDCALWIEAHAPHGDKGDRAGWRPRGSTLWEGWPEFGIGMKPIDDQTVELVRWRGDRDRNRECLWPKQLTEGRSWPWTVPISALEEIA